LPCFVKPNKAGSSFEFQQKNCCRIANRNRSRLQRRQWNHHRKFDGNRSFCGVIIKEL
jgi:hypothetical protein